MHSIAVFGVPGILHYKDRLRAVSSKIWATLKMTEFSPGEDGSLVSDGGSITSSSDRVLTYERLNWTVIQTEQCDPFFIFQEIPGFSSPEYDHRNTAVINRSIRIGKYVKVDDRKSRIKTLFSMVQPLEFDQASIMYLK